VSLALGAALVAVCSLGGSAAARTSQANRCLVATNTDDLPFGRNFNPFSQALDFTSGGIYEPLAVVTAAGGGHQYDWLASKFEWSRDRKTLTITVRKDVRWTDGTPLTAEDVAYTLTAGRQAKVMDQIGLTRPGNEVASVRVVGTDKVAVRLKRVDTSFVSSVLANNVRVVPEHVFAHVKHIGAWSNPHPVGTGPFAFVGRFGTQAYILDRNPHYWQPGLPRVPCVERVVASSGESATLQADNGSVDLTNDFFPNAQQAYVAHDPRYFHYFYPTNSPGIGLFFDDTRYPFSIVALRKAISLGIDREQLSQFAEYGYAPPVDALGINRVWPTWITKRAATESNWLATYNPGAARQMLLTAGFSYDADTLLDPKGNAVVIHGAVIGTWPDWYADWRLIARDLGQIGIKVNVDLRPDFGAWWPDASSTKRATLMWNDAVDTVSPYSYFEEHLDAASFRPSGHDSELTGDWEHFRSAEATRLLTAFRAAADHTAQHRIAGQLEQIFLRTLPFVPLFAEPTWSTYSTRYFVGFPTARDDYVDPDFSNVTYVVALTRIRPRP
jgi:peptide/nickel transport system substrate-binding protein